MEARFGSDFTEVRIHDDPQAHGEATENQAKAFTHGTDIVFGADRFAPNVASGKHLLAHELAHVVQQRRGGPTPDGKFRSGTERAAAHAADAVASSSGPVAVAGASGIGVACEKDDDEDQKKSQPPSMTV